MLIQPNSPLKNLPNTLSIKQALFFDGMSHAADIAHFAYQRLQQTLFTISVTDTPPDELIISAYLDAWTCVDATDRFRSLLKQYPKGGILPADEQQKLFIFSTNEVREIRNVADHVHQRIDHLVSKKSSALGELSWIAIIAGVSKPKYLTSKIRPGFLENTITQNLLIPPQGQTIEAPAGYIHLKAGTSTINVSTMLINLAGVIRHIEARLLHSYMSLGKTYTPFGRNMIMKAELS